MSKALLTLAVLYVLAHVDGVPVQPEHKAHAVATVSAIHELAPEFDRDPVRVAALAIKETRCRADVVGTRGEVGPLQVMPWYLRPRVSVADASTHAGGVRAGLLALERWEAHLSANPRLSARRLKVPVTAWHCYASGNHCYAPTAEARLRKVQAMIHGAASAIVVQSVAIDVLGGDDDRSAFLVDR